jgi:rubrerythrin
MAEEQKQTIDALNMAIQMEKDGKKYYQKMGESSVSRLGRQLFQTLASEEDTHRRKFEEIYNAIRQKKSWPRTDFVPDGGKKLRTIFARASDESSGMKSPTTELDAVKVAMDMENKTLDFYSAQAKTAGYPVEKGFYEALAGEEREHHMVLLDYYEYLKNPAGWFVKNEHHSLDGG